MNHGKTISTQLLEFVPFSHFEHVVEVYQANKGVSSFSAWSHFIFALALYGNEDLGLGLKGPIFAIDSTTIDLCLWLFHWAHFRQTKAAVKAHGGIDLRGAIPVFIRIPPGKIHNVRLLGAIDLPTGSILVIDRGYLDFTQLFALHQ